MGDTTKVHEVNVEGVGGLISAIKGRKPDNIVTKWVKDVGYSDVISARNMTMGEAEEFKEVVRKKMGIVLKTAYQNRGLIVPPQDEETLQNVTNPRTKKPYTKDEWTRKVLGDINNAVEGYYRATLEENEYDNQWRDEDNMTEYDRHLDRKITTLRNKLNYIVPDFMFAEILADDIIKD